MQKTEIISCILTDHNGIKLEAKTKKKTENIQTGSMLAYGFGQPEWP
jgi:hypothetical protein